MKIKELTLYSNSLTQQADFFNLILGFKVEIKEDSILIEIGNSILKFKESQQPYLYHYCFLIPSNKLEEAINWLKERLEPVRVEGERIVQHFESWNADSVYFYDGNNNLAEFIARYDLQNETEEVFDLNSIISINEIGMPSTDIVGVNEKLEREIQSKFWKGNFDRFITNGTQEGLFLLLNNAVKKTWFPTNMPTQSSPFEAVVFSAGQDYRITFLNGKLTIEQLR